MHDFPMIAVQTRKPHKSGRDSYNKAHLRACKCSQCYYKCTPSYCFVKILSSNIMDKLTIDHCSFIALCVLFSFKQLFCVAFQKKQFLLESWPHQTDVLVIMNFILELILIILMGKPYFSISTVFG